MTILGIDPGLSGAAAVLSIEGDLLDVFDLPVIGEGKQARIDSANLGALLRATTPHRAVIERVGAMPGQGVSSMFRFGEAVGTVSGILGALAIPIERVTPSRWKRDLRLCSDKEAARLRAIERWPKFAAEFARKRDHGRAEAALIGLWALEGSS